MDSRKLIPSMFHRRLVLLVVVMALVVAALATQILRLSVVEGADRRSEAESRLDRRIYLPTYRGEVRDRRGRVLARDRASYDVAIRYDVITGSWIRDRAARQARREIGSSRWNQLSPEEREAEIDRREDAWVTMTERLWAEVQRHGDFDELELERRRDTIRAEVQSLAAVVWEQQRVSWENRFGTDEEGGGFRPRPIREQREHHVMLPGVDAQVAYEFQRLSRDLDGIVEVHDASRRENPWESIDVVVNRAHLPRPLRSETPVLVRVDGIADHILGSVRDEIWAEDVDRRPFVHPRTGEIDLGGYRPGDIVGSRGIELAFEDRLRGRRGVINERRDTGEQRRVEPVPGEDLDLTLDILLQARVQALLSHELGLTRVQSWHQNDQLPIGRPLNSAAVVLEVETGEVLAMVSMPTMEMGSRMTASRRTVDFPWVNRAVEAVYPPGSIIKPLVLAAAVEEGRHALDQPIECTGHYYEEHQNIARCWIYRERFGFQNHGALRAAEAIARSCNIYFYTLGDRLGLASLGRWFTRFGLGQPLDLGLLHERPGDGGATVRVGEVGGAVPDLEAVEGIRQRGDLAFASVIMGIGQGPVTWTPVQAANAYATIARGGIVRDATLVRDDQRLTPRSSREHAPLSPRLVETILEGLRQSVEESFGTGYQIRYDERDLPPHRIMNVPGVINWAKTGTAQAPALRVDSTGDGVPDRWMTGLSHAWFVGLVGSERRREPEYAIAVIVEYGGSGGRVAGPIANEIVRALQDEGYLEDGVVADAGRLPGRAAAGARP